MGFSLKPSTTGNEDFTGKAGDNFTINMTGPAGAGLVMMSASYNGVSKTAAPFTFTISTGTKFLFVHFEALKPGAKLQVVEQSGAAQQILETIFFDPSNPGTGYEIAGA